MHILVHHKLPPGMMMLLSRLLPSITCPPGLAAGFLSPLCGRVGRCHPPAFLPTCHPPELSPGPVPPNMSWTTTWVGGKVRHFFVGSIALVKHITKLPSAWKINHTLPELGTLRKRRSHWKLRKPFSSILRRKAVAPPLSLQDVIKHC